MRLSQAVVVAAALASVAAPAGAFAAPRDLSRDHSPARIGSSYGSGASAAGASTATACRATATRSTRRPRPQAAQPELNGRRDAWHQLGNDHVVANAYNRGYVAAVEPGPPLPVDQLRRARRPATTRGGYGYLNVDGEPCDDALRRPRRGPAEPTRDFGTGYFAHAHAGRRRRGRRARLRAVRRRPAAAARRHAAQHRPKRTRRRRGSSTGTSTRTSRARTAHPGLDAPVCDADARDARASPSCPSAAGPRRR